MSTPFQCGLWKHCPDPCKRWSRWPARRSVLTNEMMLARPCWTVGRPCPVRSGNLARVAPGSKVWLVALGPKAKLQQVMMTVAQKVPFELGPRWTSFRFPIPSRRRRPWRRPSRPFRAGSRPIAGVRWMGSASRGAVPLADGGRALGIAEQFPGRRPGEGWARRQPGDPGAHRRRAAPGFGVRRASGRAGLGTGNLPDAANNPQIGMANMRAIMPPCNAPRPPSPTPAVVHSVSCPSSRERRAS